MATHQAISPDQGIKTTPAAYVSFKTFLSAIEALEHGVPKRLDRTIWRNQSGVVQSQIMMAFRFFNLVDEEDRPTPALQRIVDANADKRPEQVGALLRYAYRDIIDHDLTKISPKMLDEMMDKYNVTGDTKRKAISFFLQAARFADLPMHPLLFSTMRKSSPRKKRSKDRELENGDHENSGEPPIFNKFHWQWKYYIDTENVDGNRILVIIAVDTLDRSFEIVTRWRK